MATHDFNKLVHPSRRCCCYEKLMQLHMMDCFSPRDACTLIRDECRNALASLMCLTGKRSDKVKACTGANSSVQCKHEVKEEAAAPTSTSEAVFIQGTIFAHK